MPAAMAAEGLSNETAAPARIDLTAVPVIDPEQDPGDLRAAGPDQPREADDLALAHREADVLEYPGAGEAPDLQQDVTGRRVDLREQ